jgi:N-acetylneuraminate synthase
MKKGYNFDGLFIYDMANNHQGSVQHGTKIINEIAKVSNDENVRGALKFQFRHIDSFIHPKFREKKDIKHIPRFISTRLSDKDYADLTESVRRNKLKTIATPFDEISIDLIKKLDIEIIKVASCSATDWPLLSAVARVGKPVVVSTAGLNIKNIDNIVGFFKDHFVDFAVMHCIALYPTPIENLQLNQVRALQNRYPEISIGFSTHEPPDYYNAIRVAYSLGARLFERHVDVKAEGLKMNAYSSTAEQIKKWIRAYKETVASCGAEHRSPACIKEIESLNSLKRGVYARKKIAKRKQIAGEDIFFAMPLQNGQMESGDWRDNYISEKNYAELEPISEYIAKYEPIKEQVINQIMLQVKGILNEGRVAIGKDFTIELSHHYGLNRFREFGAVIIDCINRAYCKKLIVQLPRQKHPYHYHNKKEETFLVLHGNIDIEINGNRKTFTPGDMVVIHPKEWHKFQTSHGVIMEEISTTHYNDDSIYEDPFIAKKPRENRKTSIINWNNDKPALSNSYTPLKLYTEHS